MSILRVTIFLNDREQEMERELAGRYGTNKPSQTIRQTLRDRYDKVFPGYRTTVLKSKPVKEEAPKLTPEQQCEAMGGKVIINPNGTKVCHIVTYQNKAGEESIDLELNERSLKTYSKKNKI